MSGPDFHELVGSEGTPEELDRLRRVHDMLVAAGPPPELSPDLSEPPAAGKPAQVSFLPRRRRSAALLVAAAVVAVTFGIGYLVGHRGNTVPSSRLVAMHGVGSLVAARGSIRVVRQDDAGNWPLTFRVRGLKELPKGSWYELYLTKDGRREASCGTFKAGPGTTTVRLNAPYNLAAYDGWAVTAHVRGRESPVLMRTNTI